jgi:hypothetical protein
MTPTPEDLSKARGVAYQWLAWLDQSEYEKAWQELAPAIKSALPKSTFITAWQGYRLEFGELKSRTLVASDQRDRSTVPSGRDSIIFVFRTTIPNGTRIREQVGLQREGEGVWRVAGYVVVAESH